MQTRCGLAYLRSNNSLVSGGAIAVGLFITKDSDFVDLIDRLGIPPQIIWLTCGNTSNARLQEILPHIPQILKRIS